MCIYFRNNFPFLPQSAGVGTHTPCPAFSVGASNLSSGPHTCRANTLAHWEFRPSPAGSGLSLIARASPSTGVC